ncbi:MAG: DUF3299 domain-containing protein [Rhizobiaceae bacterium]
MNRFLIIPVLLIVALINAPKSMAEPLVLGWADLEPKLFFGQRMKLPKSRSVLGTPTAEDFQVTKSELKEFLGEIEFMKDMQPQGARLVGKLNGKKVRIPGYVTPVGFDGEDVTQFLLVPFLGACIHVPPPPANQIIYVKNAKGLKLEQIWEPVWITGILETKSVSTVLADVGYSMAQAVVEPFAAYPENVKQAH